MGGALYQLLIIIVGVIAIYRGYRQGAACEVPGIVSVVFALLLAHVFGADVCEWLMRVKPEIAASVGADYRYSALAAGLIYLPSVLILQMLTRPLRKLFGIFGAGVLGSLSGAALCLARYMVTLSVAYNLLLAYDPESSLKNVIEHDDGNLAELVMYIAPPLLGYENFEYYLHLRQLDEAKMISENLMRRLLVEPINDIPSTGMA